MMRFSRLVFSAALCAAVFPGIGLAQEGASYSYYMADPASEPSGIAPAAMYSSDVMAGPACDASCGAPSCSGGCAGGNCGRHRWMNGFCWPCGCKLEDLGEACKLWEPCCEDSPWSAGGWLAQGFTWNPYSPEDRFNGPMTWMDRSNEYQMNELYGYIARTANTEECCFDWGARVDALYGTNYRWNTSAGFESHWGNGSFYGLAVPQAYLEAAYNDVSVKFGRFFSPVGYYVIGTANNFFSVLPYTFQYGEPFTHTGAYGTYKWSEELVLGAGITHGWDNTDNTGNPHAGGLATASWTIDEERALTYVGVFGPEPNFSGVNPSTGPLPANGVGFTNRYLQTLVFTRKFSDDVLGVIQSDFGTQHDAVVAGQTAKWYGVNTYLYWNQTCRCQWGANFEWFRDQGGFRVGGVLPSFGSPNARGLPFAPPALARTGYDGSFYRLMFGPKYYFTPNVYGRAAFVADWYVGKNNNAGNLRPFDDGQRDHQQVVAFDLIATF
jgi:hypothetical protein